MSSSQRRFRITTKRDRRRRSAATGEHNPDLTWAEIKRRRWEVKQLIRKFGGRCCICDEPVNLIEGDPRQATRDHIVPLGRGGQDTFDNLRLACLDCNTKRGDRLLGEEEGNEATSE